MRDQADEDGEEWHGVDEPKEGVQGRHSNDGHLHDLAADDGELLC